MKSIHRDLGKNSFADRSDQRGEEGGLHQPRHRRLGPGGTQRRNWLIKLLCKVLSCALCSASPLVERGLLHLCFCLGRAVNIEAIKTRLDACARAQPLLLGHMGPGIPYLHAVGDGGAGRLLVTRYSRRRRCARGCC